MNDKNTKVCNDKSKLNKEKPKYKTFMENKSLKNIDNNTSYDSSEEDPISEDRKSSESSIKKAIKLDNENLEKKGKENKINININKENNENKENKDNKENKEIKENKEKQNIPAPFEGLQLNKRANSETNIFYPNTKLLNNNINNNLNNNNKIINSNINNINNLNNINNTNNNNANNIKIINNINNANNNNNINKISNINNNNIQDQINLAKIKDGQRIILNTYKMNNLNPNITYKMNNLNQNIIKNNLNNSKIINNGFYPNNNLNQYNYLNSLNKNQLLIVNNNFINNNKVLKNQNINPILLNNNLVPRATNIKQIPTLKMGIGLNGYNSSNINNEIKPRLTNIPISNRYTIENIEKERKTVVNTVSTNYQNNIFNINYGNVANTPTKLQQLRPSYKSEISQASNLEIKDLNNYVNDRNTFQTISQANQNEYLHSSLDDYLKQLTNKNINQMNAQNQNSYFNITQNNQFLNNYGQEKNNNIFNEDFLLRDFGVLSRPGNEKSGMSKTNQDSFISKTNIKGLNNFNIFGVLDGHGPEGHLISQFASEFIPNYIINNKNIQSSSNTNTIYNILRQNNYQIIKQAFILANNRLKTINFDAKESGTTCVLVIHIGNHLICANVGDSRAIVAFDETNDPNLTYLRAIPLSIDYKLELPEEKSRIIMSGGMVEQAVDELGLPSGPFRVYAPGKEYPGLAMSRSIGDLIAKTLGVIPDPGIMEYNLNKNTKFFILCSDGVWEFLNNNQVKDIGKQFYLNSNATELCQELISRSVIEWKYNDNTIDDITAIAVFF